MATIQTIATTLTADARPAAQELRRFEGDVGKSFERLGARTKEFNNRAAEISLGGRGGGRGRNLAGGFLELSRGLEDASIGYQLNGIQGAVRGASNNLSAFAFLVGGPVTAAVVGLGAAALPTLVNWLTKTEEKAADAKKRLDDMRESMGRAAEQARARAQFEGLIGGLDTGKELEREIEQKQQRLRELEAEFKAIEGERRTPFAPGTEKAFEDIAQREAEARERQNKLLDERVRLENEINRLIAQRPKLNEQDKAGEDWERRLDKAEEMERKRERDRQQIEGMLVGKFQGLGGKIDPLDGLAVPRGMEGRLREVLGEVDKFNEKPKGAQFAQVATADSQSLLRAQQQAREAAERKKEAAALQKKLDDLIREVKGLRRDGQDDGDKDDVNLT